MASFGPKEMRWAGPHGGRGQSLDQLVEVMINPSPSKYTSCAMIGSETYVLWPNPLHQLHAKDMRCLDFRRELDLAR